MRKTRLQQSRLQSRQDLRIGLRGRPGGHLDGPERGHGGSGEESSRVTYGGDQDGAVDGVLQSVVADDGFAGGVGSVQGDGAAAEGFLERDGRGAGAWEGEFVDGGVGGSELLDDDRVLGVVAGEEGGVGGVEGG